MKEETSPNNTAHAHNSADNAFLQGLELGLLCRLALCVHSPATQEAHPILHALRQCVQNKCTVISLFMHCPPFKKGVP